MILSLPLLVLSLACSRGDAPDLHDLSARWDPDLPTVLHLSASVEPAAPAILRVGYSEDVLDITVEREAAADHVFTLSGLPQGAPLWFRVDVEAADGGLVRGSTGHLTVPSLGVPDLEVQISDVQRSQLVGRWVIVAAVSDRASGIVAYDIGGRAVWGLPMEFDRTPSWPWVDGTDLVFLDLARDRTVDDAWLRRVPFGGGELPSTRMATGHHGFALLPDGDVAWLGLSFWDQEVASLGLGAEPWRVYADTVWRAPEGDGGAGVRLFSYEQDYPWDFFQPCDHVLLEEDRLGERGVHEWTHSNSIAFLPEWNALLTGSRHHDSLVAIDADTGEWLWQAGGRDGWPVADPWSHGHFSDAWEGGLLYFDNGLLHERQVSRVLELAVDPEAGTVETVWSFEQPEEGFTSFLGDAKRLDNGHVLMAFTEEGVLAEVTPEGERVWQARLPGYFIGRVAVR